MAGLELDRRMWGRARLYASLHGGYGRLDDTPRIRGFGARRDAWFAMGSGLATGGLLWTLTHGLVESTLRAGAGARGVFVDVPSVAWEVAPASDLGLAVRIGRGSVSWVMDARWWMSQFNAERFPLVRLPAQPVSITRDVFLSTGLRWRLAR